MRLRRTRYSVLAAELRRYGTITRCTSMKESKPPKWTPIDQTAVEQLSRATNSPGIVYSLGTNQLPQNLQAMPNAVSYFVSGYTSAQSAVGGVIPGGEIAVVRTAGGLSKAYQFVFGTSTDGRVCFTGPFTNFLAHHFSSDSAISVTSLFGAMSNLRK
jgi:hypothetical protein